MHDTPAAETPGATNAVGSTAPSSTDPGPSLRLGEPARADAPDGLELTALAVSGSRIFVAGDEAGGAPVVRVGELGPGSVAWSDRIALRLDADADVEIEPELWVDERSRTRLAVARRGQDWHRSLLVIEETSQGWTRREALPPWRTEGAGGFEFEYGSPTVLRGDELFTLTFPGATLDRGRLGEASSTLLLFHGDGSGRPTVLPFAEGATELGWGLAVTPDGATLALVAAHGSDGYQIDLYARGGTGFEPTQSVAVSGPPWTSVVSIGSRIVVVARALVVLREHAGRWSEERRLALPDTEETARGVGSHLTPIASGDRLFVWRADRTLFAIDLAAPHAVRTVELPADVERRALRAWAVSGPWLVALHGGEILWWSLDDPPASP